MKNTYLKRILFTGVIIAVFICSSSFFITNLTGINKQHSNSTLSPKISTTQINSNPIGDEWPMFHGNLNHTGYTETTPVIKDNIIWNFTNGGGMEASPIIADGVAYIEGEYGGGNGNFYCINASTGVAIWNNSAIEGAMSAPAIANDMVFVGSIDSNLYCLNSSTGVKIWNYTTGIGNIIVSSPAVANGMVYFGSSDDNVYCLNATNSTLIWKYPTGNMIMSSPVVANDRVYIGSEDNNTYCLNATNGSFIWKYTATSPIDSSPSVFDGKVYIGSNNGTLYCLNVNNGISIWNYTTGSEIYSCPTIANGLVYVGSNDNNTYCLNATTGSLIWKYTTDGGIISSPAIANGMVYIGSGDNNTYCFNATTGSLIWNYTTGSTVTSSPAIANGVVYFSSDFYNLYCFPMIMCKPPSAPLNLQAVPGIGNIALTWQKPTNNGGSAITNYKIYKGTSSGSFTLLTTVSNVTNFMDTGLSGNTTNYYEISAINPAGEGPKSSEISATTLATIPSAPLNLQATPSYNNITLIWQAPSNNGGSTITGYKIYRGNSTGSETLLTTVGDVLTYTDTGLSANTTYYYEVCAINSVGIGPKSSEISVKTFVSFSSNSSNSSNSSTNHKIDGMGIGVILSVSLMGVIVTMVAVKKRLK